MSFAMSKPNQKQKLATKKNTSKPKPKNDSKNDNELNVIENKRISKIEDVEKGKTIAAVVVGAATVSAEEPQKSKTKTTVEHSNSKSSILPTPRDKNTTSVGGKMAVKSDGTNAAVLNNNTSTSNSTSSAAGAQQVTGIMNNSEDNVASKNSVQNNNNNNKLSQKKIPNNSDVKNVNLNKQLNQTDSKDVRRDNEVRSDKQKIISDGNKKSAVKTLNNETSKKLPDKTLIIDIDAKDKLNNDSSDKKPVNNLGALAKKKWSKISAKDLTSGNNSPVLDKKSLNGLILNADNLDGSLSVPNTEDRNADTKSLLSVTSGARRGSIDSRRSFDIGARVGLMQATVVNPPDTDAEKPRSVVSNDDSYIRNAIPFLPLPIAIICLLFNIFIPGFGTVLSGISIYCCGKPRVHSKDDHKAITFCVNVWIGLCQLFTIPLCLVGWFWSIAWGILAVSLAVQHRKEQRGKRERELQALAVSAFAPNGPTIHPIPVAVP